MADVGFDSNKHAQTSEDMEKGEQSLTDFSQTISRLIDAQGAEYWSEGVDFQAVRYSLIAYLRTGKDVVSNQKARSQKFDGDVDTTANAFEATEQGNTDEPTHTLASMDPQPAGAPSSLATQAPSQIVDGGPTSSDNANGATTSGPEGSGSGAGTGPTQNTPSEV